MQTSTTNSAICQPAAAVCQPTGDLASAEPALASQMQPRKRRPANTRVVTGTVLGQQTDIAITETQHADSRTIKIEAVLPNVKFDGRRMTVTPPPRYPWAATPTPTDAPSKVKEG